MASKGHEESSVAQAIKRIEEDDIEYDDTPLGRGTYGIVWKGTWTCKVAIKKYTIPESGIPREVLTLGSVRTHENITTLYGVVQHRHTIGIVMEYAPDGSLYDYLHTKGLKPSLEQSVEWATQVARGMKHLHDNDIVHRDLKSQNILLSEKVAKICDFGTARFLEHTTKQSGTEGTYRWMAPEVMKCEDARINRRCDTYSYAMVLYELFENKIPFHEIQTEPINMEIAIAVLKNAQRPKITVRLPPYIRGLIEICWREDPEKRLAFDQVLQALKTQDVSEWEAECIIIARSDLIIGKRIGQGGFGAVYEGKWKQRKVAMKMIVGDARNSREVVIHQSLSPHPNIVTFYGLAYAADAQSTLLVMELVEGDSLYSLLHVKNERPSNEVRFQWMKDVATGMEFLHSNDIVHLDPKSDNVLIRSTDQTAKLFDFGCSRKLTHTTMTFQKGTVRWMAPEVLEDIEACINKKADVYSYSMLLVELVTLQVPFHGVSTLLAAMKVLQGKRPTLPPPGSKCPPYLHRLITACWDGDPNVRPSFERIQKALESKTFP